MTIKASLKLVSLVTFGIAISSSMTIFTLSYKLNQKLEESRVVEQIHDDVFGLNILTTDYLFNREPRTQKHWLSQHSNIGTLLESGPLDNYQGQPDLINLKASHQQINEIFNNLSKTYSSRDQSEPDYQDKESVELESRLVNQLLIESENIFSSASSLSEAVRVDFAGLQRLVILVVFIAVAVLLSFVSLGVFLIFKLVIKPLVKLTKDIGIIGKGDLEHKIDITDGGEIGRMADIFNTITSKLKESYSNLEQKVLERTKELNQQKKTLEEQQDAILNILEDVEETKNKLVLSEKKFHDIVESTSDWIWEVNQKGQYTFVSEKVFKILGYKPKEILGKTPFDFMPPEEAKRVGQIFEKISAQKLPIKDLENCNLTKDKRKIWFATNGVPVLDSKNNLIGYRGVDKDVTKAKDIDRMKTEFISLASHQLRTPLSAIKWFLEMLLAGDAGKLSIKQREYITNIDQSNERMIALINDLLSISRIETGRIIIKPIPTDINQLIKEVITELDSKLKANNQTPVVNVQQGLGKIILDPKLVRNIYINLLTNAIKYSPRASKISISISKKGDQIISQITDSGVGIPQKEQSRVFDKFYRGENVVKLDTDGTGLGLYLTKIMVESFGGKLWFKSRLNQGTTFWFSLPLKGMRAKKGEVSIDA